MNIKKHLLSLVIITGMASGMTTTANAFTNIRDISGIVETLVTNAPAQGGVEVFVITNNGLCYAPTQGALIGNVSVASLIALRRSQREQVPITIECVSPDSIGETVNIQNIIIAY